MSRLKLYALAAACLALSALCADVMDDAIKAFGKHRKFNVSRQQNGEVLVETPAIALRLYPASRNYCMKEFGPPGAMECMQATITWNNVPDASEMYGGNHVTAVNIRKCDGGFRMDVKIDSSHMHVLRTFEFYNGRPYIRVHYDVTAARDAFCPRQLVHVILPRSARMLAYQQAENVVYFKNKLDKVNWFNIDRPDDCPCVAYLRDGGKGGVAVLCPDTAHWKGYPGKMLSSAGKDGGFTLELNKWAGKDVRAGDETWYEIFLAPVDSFEAARNMLAQMTGRQ